MPCEALAVYLPTLLAPAGLFAEKLTIALRLLHSVSRMEATLKIRAGYDIAFNCFQEVPMLLMLSVHPSRQQDLLTDHVMRFSPNVQARDFSDAFGNVCTRLVAPPGLIEIRNEFLIADSGLPDEINSKAEQCQWETCRMRPLRIYWEADIAIHRNFRIRHGRCSAGSAAAGNGLRQSAITFMFASNSDTTMPDVTG